MIDLYSWATPNGHKIHIMLEETGLPYRVHPVDIGAGDQFKPEFLKISPNNKMPAMIDSDGPRDEKTGKPMSMFESGAMLLYLASKSGKFLPDDLRERWSTLQWLMFQMGGVGPMLGQAHHFLGYAPEKIPYAMQRYAKEANRLYGVMDRRLTESRFIACDEYTIADMAIMPWLRYPERQGVNMDDYPHLKKWFDGIAARPAVQRGLKVLADLRKPLMDDKAKEMLFGATQYQKR
ncbi:MAG: glutathione binding-like protein [Proteobacteria bacterium]|nr:glutathione binding-like protein [Pseudomonadota bacterium]